MSEKSNDSGVGAKPRLLDLVHQAVRRRYFSRRTEEAYVHWIKRFIYFSGKRHPRDLGEPEASPLDRLEQPVAHYRVAQLASA